MPWPDLRRVDAVVGSSSTYPLPLPPGFAGWALIVQPALLCAAEPLGISLLHAMQLEISRG